VCDVYHVYHVNDSYGVATISRLLKIVDLFCRISSLLQVSFAKETYNLKEPTKRMMSMMSIASMIASNSHRLTQYI